MASCKMTLIGMEKYMNKMNDSIFAYMSMPDFINTEVLEKNILLRSGEFEVLYSDPDFLKELIGMWSTKYRWTIDHWISALENVDNFNPLENYDRTEEWNTDTTSENTSSSNSSNDSTSTDSVTAYDSNNLQTASQNHTVDTNTASANLDASANEKRTGRAHGNIGVTSLSQLFVEYQKNTATWNIYEKITDIFLAEFIIPVF